MGNYSSCLYVQSPQIAKLIDIHGNIRQVNLPITAAEIMLEDPGHVLSPADDIKRTHRIPVMKADDLLSAGNVYLLVPASRAHCNVSESEMAKVIEYSGRKKKGANRRSSKVSPTANCCPDQPGRVTTVDGNGSLGYSLVNHRQWIPVLETISE